MGEVHRRVRGEPSRRRRHDRSSKDAKVNLEMEAEDKEALEAEEADGLPIQPSTKGVGTATRMLATKHAPTILEIRKKKAAARRKRSQQAGKEPHGTSRTHEGTSVDPSAPASTVHSGASSSRKEGSLLGEKGQGSHTAAQDSRHTATESDRLRGCNAGSLPSTSASWKKRLCVAVALVAVMAFVAVAGLLGFLWSRHRAREAAMASANKSVPSNTTKQSGGPVKKEKPAVQAIVTSVVKILGMVHRLLH